MSANKFDLKLVEPNDRMLSVELGRPKGYLDKIKFFHKRRIRSMGKSIVFLFIISVFFTRCEKQTDKNETVEFSILNGNNFLLKIDRVSNMPNVQFPHDSLQESDYVAIDEEISYDLIFSEDGQIVTIEPGSVSGEKINDGEEIKYYELVEGLFAGGRFIIWINHEDFEAELTIYGSGIPIIRSERGKLELVKK